MRIGTIPNPGGPPEKCYDSRRPPHLSLVGPQGLTPELRKWRRALDTNRTLLDLVRAVIWYLNYGRRDPVLSNLKIITRPVFQYPWKYSPVHHSPYTSLQQNSQRY